MSPGSKSVVGKLGLGSVQFGLDYGVTNFAGKTPQKEVSEVLQKARVAGIHYVDTAMSYGDSERALGAAGVDDFRIVTKLDMSSYLGDDITGYVIKEVQRSLETLRVPNLYGVLLHRSADATAAWGRELIGALLTLQRDGYIKKVGVSIYDVAELGVASRVMPLDLVQAPLSVMDRRLETSGWLDKLKKNSTEVHVRSIFLQGLLICPRRAIPAKFERWAAIWDRWSDELSRRQVTALSVCLSYPLSLPSVDKVIVGLNNSRQLDAILQASVELPDSDDWNFMTQSDYELIDPTSWNSL